MQKVIKTLERGYKKVIRLDIEWFFDIIPMESIKFNEKQSCEKGILHPLSNMVLQYYFQDILSNTKW